MKQQLKARVAALEDAVNQRVAAAADDDLEVWLATLSDAELEQLIANLEACERCAQYDDGHSLSGGPVGVGIGPR